MGKLLLQGELIPKDPVKAIAYLEKAAAQNHSFAAYLAGKALLTEPEIKDVLESIDLLETAAEKGHHFAEYLLGKSYLFGTEVPQDIESAIRYLSSSASHGNQYAQQLLHSYYHNRNWNAALSSIRLLHHLCQVFQNKLSKKTNDNAGGIDRKLRRKIDEKKQAQGIKQ